MKGGRNKRLLCWCGVFREPVQHTHIYRQRQKSCRADKYFLSCLLNSPFQRNLNHACTVNARLSLRDDHSRHHRQLTIHCLHHFMPVCNTKHRETGCTRGHETPHWLSLCTMHGYFVVIDAPTLFWRPISCSCPRQLLDSPYRQ